MTSPAAPDDVLTRPGVNPPSPRRGGAPLTFLPPIEEETTSPSSPAPATTGEGSSELPGSPSADEWRCDELDASDDSGTTSSPASSGSRSPGAIVGKAAAKATAAQAVIIAGGMAHRIAARTEMQQQIGLYLTDEQDAESIGHPLGEMVARRGGVAGKALSPDANDALAALMGIAQYVSKQVAKIVQIQQVEQQLRAQQAPGEQ
jgi:hypothetical protein